MSDINHFYDWFLIKPTEKEVRADVDEAEKKRAVEEYGNVEYADPENKKYPIDTPKHIRAAWSYIHMPKNAEKYSGGAVEAIKARIRAAWKKEFGSEPSAEKEFIDSIEVEEE